MTSTTPMKKSMTGKTHLDSKGEQWIRVEEGDIANLVKEVLKDLRPDEVYHMEEIIKTVQESCDPREVFGDAALTVFVECNYAPDAVYSLPTIAEIATMHLYPQDIFSTVDMLDSIDKHDTDDVKDWCKMNASPEDLFEVVELESWAETNGWVLADHEAERL